MIFLLLALLIPLCCWLAYRCGVRDGERAHQPKIVIPVHPTPLYVTLDPALIADVLAAEGWTVTRPEPPAAPAAKPKPH